MFFILIWSFTRFYAWNIAYLRIGSKKLSKYSVMQNKELIKNKERSSLKNNYIHMNNSLSDKIASF